MLLRGVEFGDLFCAPGALGWYGEGYRYHRLWKLFGMTWRGMTFVAKTTTLHPRKGFMPIRSDTYGPQRLFPDCVVVKPISGHILNAVGLSGPGAQALFARGGWNQIVQPFMLSFMSVAPTRKERLKELNGYVEMLAEALPCFQAPVALQINCGCPNVGLHLEEVTAEIMEMLDISAVLDIPLVLNFNPLVPVSILVAASKHPALDGFWIGNSVPWGDAHIDWIKLFGSDVSPLLMRGYPAGGLSGPACLPLVIDKLILARKAGIKTKIVAGNSIRSAADVCHVRQAGADAVFAGTVAIVRPWQMRSIARCSQQQL